MADEDPWLRFVLWWGIHDRSVRQVVEFFVSRGEAEETLEVILGDEPEWASILEVVPLVLGDAVPN